MTTTTTKTTTMTTLKKIQDEYFTLATRVEEPLVRFTGEMADSMARFVPERPTFMAKLPTVAELVANQLKFRRRFVDEQLMFVRKMMKAMDPMVTRLDTVFKGRVHVGYLAAIVAASNGGGAGSVVGDTTTTMMWIAGVAPKDVFEAYIGSGLALFIFGVPASLQQQAFSPIQKDETPGLHIDWVRVAVVAIILVAAVVVNVVVNTHFKAVSDSFPFLGVAVWVAIALTTPARRPDWSQLPGALKGSVFLLSLVLCASMMPVEHLPAASWYSALGLGFLSAVFDNIPLTALAIKQGGYDWGFLAYAVGFGGSMIWFGSSAGVALASMYPQARSVGAWVRHGWYVPVAYVAGFMLMLVTIGFHPGSLTH